MSHMQQVRAKKIKTKTNLTSFSYVLLCCLAESDWPPGMSVPGFIRTTTPTSGAQHKNVFQKNCSFIQFQTHLFIQHFKSDSKKFMSFFSNNQKKNSCRISPGK